MRRKKDIPAILILVIAVVAVLLLIVFKVLPALQNDGRGNRIITDKLKLGQKYLSEMDYDQAIAAFTEALEIDDRNTEAYVGLGDAYTGKEDWTPAVRNYDEGIQTIMEQVPVDDIREEDTETVIERHQDLSYAENEEWTLLAAMENETVPELQGILRETIDVEYVIEIIERRNYALNMGILVFFEPDAEDTDYRAWLVDISHPDYMLVDNTSESPDDNTDNEKGEGNKDTELFEKKIVELVKEYDQIPDEDRSWTVEVDDQYLIQEMPDSLNLYDEGILFADLYDYDADEELELLVFRKQAGTESASIWDGQGTYDRVVYHLEMYEIENGVCVLAADRKMGVFGKFLPMSFINQALLVFRHSTEDGTEICIESYLSEMDHMGDDELLTFRYADSAFIQNHGVRFGTWWDNDYPDKYLNYKSPDAYEYLSCRDYTYGWNLVTEGEKAPDHFAEGLETLGFSLLKKRNQLPDESLRNDEKTNASLYAMTATEHLAPMDGEITELYQMFFYSEHWASEGTQLSYKRIRNDVRDYLHEILEKRKTELPSKENANTEGGEPANNNESASTKKSGNNTLRDQDLITSLPDTVPTKFIFSSGTGAWATEISLEKDGSFTAHFQDSNIDTVYYCDFSGEFSNIKQVNEYTYSMELDELNVQTQEGEEELRDGITWIGSGPYGFDDNGKEYLVFLAETPIAGLDETFLSWVNPIHSVTGDCLGCVAIYDSSGEKHFGFVGISE